VPGSVTQGSQHEASQAGCFGSTLCHTSHPPCCHPSPCCTMQVTSTQRRSRARRVGLAPPAGTRLGSPELSTALQNTGGCSVACLWLDWSQSFPCPGTVAHPAPRLALLFEFAFSWFLSPRKSLWDPVLQGTAVLQKHIHGG